MGWLDDLTLETVIVHTTAGLSVKGLRSAVYEDCMVLREAHVFEDGAVNVLNGEIVIPREMVLFVQRISGPISADGRLP